MLWLIAVSLGCCSLWFAIRLLKRKQRALVELRAKTVLITGASSGLGEALARRLFGLQCQLILVARRLERLETLRDELIALHPTYPVPKLIQLDLARYEEIPSSVLAQTIDEQPIDCLINNAGISQRSSALDTSMDNVADIFRINYLSLVTLTKLVLTKMIARQQHNCSIVNISSVQGLIPVPDRSSYSASKHAVQAFSDSLRMELAEQHSQANINVSVISPSYIRTELGQQASNRSDSQPKQPQSSQYEPDYVARRIIKAIETRERNVLIAPWQQYLAIWLRHFWPEGYFKMMVARNKRLKSRN